MSVATAPIPYIPANPTNYTKGRVVPLSGEGAIAGLAGHGFVVDSLCLHRTAVSGDTSQGECEYYAKPSRQASFHEAIGQDGKRSKSVLFADRAWAVIGGAFVQNGKTITDSRIANYRTKSIELCGLNGTALTSAQVTSTIQAILEAKKESPYLVLNHLSVSNLKIGKAGLYDHRQASVAFAIEGGHQDFILDADWAKIMAGLSSK